MPRSGMINPRNCWVNHLPQLNSFTTIAITRYQRLHQLRALYGRSANHLLMSRNREKPNLLVQKLIHETTKETLQIKNQLQITTDRWKAMSI